MESLGSDLDRVTCIVETQLDKYLHYVDRSYIEPKLTLEATTSLKASGMNVRAGITPHPRGGGKETIIEMLQALLQLKDVLGLLVFIVKIPAIFSDKLFEASYRKIRPYMIVRLSINSDKTIPDERFFDDLSDRLAFLNIAAATVANELRIRYPVYAFNTNVYISIDNEGFSASYTDRIDGSSRRHKRLTRVISALKFERGVNLSVSVISSGLLKHVVTLSKLLDNSPHRTYDWRFIPKKRPYVYYTLVSSKIVGGYERDNKTMEYLDYKRMHIDQ